MINRKPRIPWGAIALGVGIVYSTMALSGLVIGYVGLTAQTNRLAYHLLPLLMGSLGVAIALRVAETTRLSYLAMVGIGVWLLNSAGVLLNVQSLTGWVTRSVYIAMALILGRLSVGSSLDTGPTPTLSCTTLVQQATRMRRKA